MNTKNPKPKLNHLYSLGFSLDTTQIPENVSAFEIRRAALRRIADLNDEELREAVGAPLETIESIYP